MDLRNIIRMVRKTWLITVALTLVGGAVGAGLATLTPKEFAATTRMYIAYSATAASTPGDLVQANNFAVQKVHSYVDVVTTPRVLDQVIGDLGLDLSAAELADQVEVVNEPTSVLLDITATDRSPEDAATLANAIGSAFADVVVGELEAPVGGGAAPVRAEVLQDAVPPKNAVAPDLVLYVAIGLFAGLVIGLLFAVIVALADRRIHSRADVQRLTGHHALAGLPKRAERRFELVTAPDPATGESLRMVRSALELAADGGPVLVTVTSPTAADRSSSAAAGLARSFASGGRRVLLIDGDFADHRLGTLLGVDDRPGLAEVLTGSSAAPIASGVDNLELMAAGTGDDLSRLIGTSTFRTLLERMSERYDAIVIAAGPVLTSGDATLYAVATRNAILITALGTSTRDELTASVDQLEAQDGVEVGVVVSRVPSRGPDADAQSQALAVSAKQGTRRR